jgi:hypothetical protein
MMQDCPSQESAQVWLETLHKALCEAFGLKRSAPNSPDMLSPSLRNRSAAAAQPVPRLTSASVSATTASPRAAVKETDGGAKGNLCKLRILIADDDKGQVRAERDAAERRIDALLTCLPSLTS